MECFLAQSPQSAGYLRSLGTRQCWRLVLADELDRRTAETYRRRVGHDPYEQTFSHDGSQYVCAACVVDEHLAEHITNSASADRCDFCGQTGDNLAMPVDDLFDHMESQIRQEYTPALESVEIPFGNDWGVEVLMKRSADVLYELGSPLGEGELLNRFCSSFTDDWIDNDYWPGRYHERLSNGWDRFATFVKEHSRFTFLNGPAAGGSNLGAAEVEPAQMLDALGDLLRVTHAVILLPMGETVFRGRKHAPSERLTTAEDLGAPPPRRASSQRMSPPGMAYFYGAQDAATCLAELRGVDGEVATVAGWTTSRHSYVVALDLEAFVEVPSLFDPDRADQREAIMFLHQFAKAISQPVRAHDMPEIDYVPTQIVADFIRHYVTSGSGDPVSGIRYPSSARSEGTNWVFFPDGPDDREDAPLLELTTEPVTYEAIDVKVSWQAVPTVSRP